MRRSVFVLFVVMAMAARAGRTDQEAYGRIPLAFEPNVGQTAGEALFLARGPGYTIFLGADEAVFALHGGETTAALRMELAGANENARARGDGPLPGRSHYYIGRDPARWHTGVPSYSGVVLEEVYPGVDLHYYGNPRELEYDFVLAPGADPEAIGLRFEGAPAPAIDTAGDLVLELEGREVRLRKPLAYQKIAEARRPVDVRYAIGADGGVGFELGDYDRALPLVIDPVVAYSTFIGGMQAEIAYAAAVDGSGNAYVTGYTTSPDFPSTTGVSSPLTVDAFATKLNAAGTAIVYSTYFGGSTSEVGRGIAVDSAGNAYVVGETTSIDYPTTPGAFATVHGGNFDAFVAKLDGAGLLTFSTFLGGSQPDVGSAIAVDAGGSAYVTGLTSDAGGFPTTPGAYDTTFNGGSHDAFVTKIDPTGSALTWSTLLGGNLGDESSGIALGEDGSVYLTGQTASQDFPTTPGAHDTTFNGGSHDAFVTKIDPSGSMLSWSTYLGGEDYDQGTAIAVDGAGDVYVGGHTGSTLFPTTPGAHDTSLDSFDGFVTKLNADGSSLSYSTFIGGAGTENGRALAVDSGGNAIFAGTTSSADYPVTPDAHDTSHNGGNDAVVTMLNAAGSQISYSTFLGGSGHESAWGVAVDTQDNIYVTGETTSTDFTTTPGSFQPVYNGGSIDAFVTKLSTGLTDTIPPQLVAFDFSPTTIDTTSGPADLTVTLDLTDDLAGVRQACVSLRSPSGQVQPECAHLVSGTNLGGTWEAVVTFPELVEAGVWQVDRVVLWDFTSNQADWDTATLAGAGFPTDLTVISLSDVTPPTVYGLGFSPPTVDVSSGPVTVTVTVDVSDDASGVASADVCHCAYIAVWLRSAHGQERLISNLGLTLVAGTILDGTWTGSFVMPEFSEAGMWEVLEIRFLDAVRNVARLHAADLAAAGLPSTLEVVAPLSDLTPPQLLDLDFAPTFINASSSTQIVTVDIDASDDLSGVDFSPFVELGSGPFFGVVFRSPSGAQSAIAGPRPAWQQIAGTPASGTWTQTAAFRQFAEAGTWTVDLIVLKDTVGNSIAYSREQVAAAGLPTEIIVIQPSLLTDGTLSPAGGTVSDSVFGTRAQIIAPPGVFLLDTEVAIDVLTSPLAIPAPSGYSGTGTYYVNVSFTPEPAMPLPPPGLTIVLPLADPMIPGQPIDLFRVDPATGALVPSLGVDGLPITGSVDPGGLSARFIGVAQFSTVVGLVPSTISVAIDIKPGDDGPAPINSRSNGKTPVAILSSPGFDAIAMLDPSTLTFGRTGTEESLAFCNLDGEDVNDDGRDDLVCHFNTRDSGFRAGDTVGLLRGETTAGVPIEGSDAIKVVK